jgi:Xaa-Pro aminopeptidase
VISRRDVLSASAGAALLTGAAAAAAPKHETRAGEAAPPDLSFLKSAELADTERLRFFMRSAGVDALVVAKPANVFYVTNHWPQLDRMGWEGSAIAVIAADPKRPIALVMHAFLYYYTHSPESEFTNRLVFPYTQPAAGPPPTDGSEPAAAPGRTMRVADPSLMSARDLQRAEALRQARPTSADASWALMKALRELNLHQARLGIDTLELQTTLGVRQMGAAVVPAENVLRRARMAKSPTEIRLMRLAAQQNVDAAMLAARAVRELGSTRLLRARFFSEAAARGNAPVFMVINGTSTEVLDEPIRDGMAFSIDCVSSCRFYHGDFARTIFVGEPNPRAKRATAAIATAWAEIRAQLKAGLRFADIPRLGRESLKKQGVDLNVSFTPHSVGLFHTDHPQPSLLTPRGPDELVLEEGTILSVDCPVLESGLGGTMHLEDLMLIRKDGAEPIHHVPETVITV